MKKIFTIAIIAFSMNSLAQIPTNGLIGFWPFNANANDESGNGHNGIVNGATLTDDRFGIADKAYYFDGDFSFINLTNSFDTVPRTIDLWFLADEADYGDMHGCIYQSDSPNLAFGNAGVAIKEIDEHKKLLLTISGNTDITDMVINSWNNLAISLDLDKTIRYYYNGSYLGEKNFNDYITSDYGMDSAIIGANRFTNGQFFKGKIDDIRIYNKALNQSEITAIYNEGICYQTVTVTDTLIINANIAGFNPVTYINTIKIYPNPANDHIIIDFGSNFSTMNGYTLQITNSLSQVVFTTSINQQQTTVDLSAWSGNGIYFVHLIDAHNNTIDIKKIVIR